MEVTFCRRVKVHTSPPVPGPLRERFDERVQRAGVYEVCVRFGEEQEFVDDLIGPRFRRDWTFEFKLWMGSNAVRRNSYQHCLTQNPAPPPPSVIIHWTWSSGGHAHCVFINVK
jgi:hypothetical protein